MKTVLNVYKRKVYVPKDIAEFPDRGEVTALVGSAAMLVVFKNEPKLVKKDLKYFEEVVDSGL